MASTPTPRSYNVILGSMIDALLSKLGIPSLPPGDPILDILEAAAQSDLRTSQDIFQLLSSISLDKATGIALERIGADEGLQKISESPSSGLVTISDSSFAKIQSTIFQGTSAPIIGSNTVNIVDASGWPASGNIYIGRETNQYEGPLAYSSITNAGSYYTINLSGGNFTQKFHNLGETVILAQGGNRQINAGVVVQTTPGNTGDVVQFSTLYSATIPDGETEVQSVTVVCKKPGTIGNVAAEAINSFVSAPFVGAVVINPTSFNNGQASESEKAFKERIRNTRQSRSRGTAIAIKTAVNGISSVEENKRVLSSSVVTREGYPATVYIDDGSGYEEKTSGVAYEVISDSALGGEQFFSLVNGRPVAKAFLESKFSAPYNLSSDSKLAVKVGGIVSEHSFSSSDFLSIVNATAYEVVASINGNPNITFSARTSSNGTKVVLFADDDVNEDLEISAVSSGTDSNVILGFSSGRTETLRLFKNDVLLNKDGSLASLVSNPQNLWGVMSGSQTIQITIDGVNISGISNTYTISNTDFVDAGTPFNSVSSANSLDSWATVLNFKIPGINATVSSGRITITSNLGRSSRASVSISGGTLVSNNMFAISEAYGDSKDYSLNRNLGLIRLESNIVLSAGDRLTAGSLNSRSFIESSAISSVNLTSDAELWFCIDGNAQVIKTGVQAGTVLVYSVISSTSWGKRVRITTTAQSFANVVAGDWLIINDSNLISSGDSGSFRIARKDPSNYWIEIERASAYVASGSVTLSGDGFKVVRTTSEPQRIIVPTANNYTALSIVQQLNSQLRGASAYVYRTNKIRVRTNTFDLTGDIALTVSNTEGLRIGLPVGDFLGNITTHTPSVITGNNQAGTPNFILRSITTPTSGTVITGAGLSGVNPGNFLVATNPDIDGTADGLGRYSNKNHISSINNVSGTTTTIRTSPLSGLWLPNDLVCESSPFAISPNDQIVAVVDDDTLTKRYSINMFRRITPTTATYGLTNKFTDADNAASSLAKGFGLSFDWNDFAVWMKARTKSHLSGGINTTKTILWRYYRHGPDGESARLQYRYPLAESESTSIQVDNSSSGFTDIKVHLPAGPARTGQTIRQSTKIGIATTSVSSGLYTKYYVLGFNVSSASRTSNVTTLLLGLPGPLTDHGFVVGNQIYLQSSSGSFSSGVKVITSKTSTTVSYSEVAADIAATPNIGTVSYDSFGIATLSGSTVTAGDIIGINPGQGLARYSERIFTLDVNGLYWQTTSDSVVATSTILSWTNVSDLTKLSFFPVHTTNNTATLISTAVNAISNSIVSAVAVGGGTGQISYATYEASPNGEGALTPWYSLTDGMNFVRTNNLTPLLVTSNYELEFKKSITSSLAADSDWGNEDVRLAPTTAKNVVDFLNSTSTSGLSSVAEVSLSSDGQSVQIASLSPGVVGSIQIQGGSANTSAAAIKNSCTRIGSTQYSVGSFNTLGLSGVSSGTWVELQNTTSVPKSGRITSSTTLSSLDSIGNFTLSSTKAWDYASTFSGVFGPYTWQFIKHGRYVQVRSWGGSAFSGVREGDVVLISSAGSTTNNGTFRIVRTFNDSVFWIENENAVEETVTATMLFVRYDSILPGDALSINTDVWGVGNVGNFTVSSVDFPAPFGSTGNQYKFTVSKSTSPVTSPVALGSNYSLVQVVEQSPSKLLKFITSISPTSSDASASDVKFDSYYGYEKVGYFAGTILRPVDKLSFIVDVSAGVDGYSYSTGLIAEANKVLYGLESDPSTYPGVIVSGGKVNISGPLVKRIQISLGLRVKTGINQTDVINRVKSEVASVVNNTAIGSAISISDVVKSAQNVAGVLAVSVVSPTYDVSNDLIRVQPFEKPLILNVDSDVLVSLVGS